MLKKSNKSNIFSLPHVKHGVSAVYHGYMFVKGGCVNSVGLPTELTFH